MSPCLPDVVGRTEIKNLFSRSLSNYIDYRRVEDWFNIGDDVLLTLEDVDTLLGVKNNPDIDIISLYMSPYKRFFCYYLDTLGITPTSEIQNAGLLEGFHEFFIHKDELVSPLMRTNISDVYRETADLTIKYKIEYDSLVVDLRKIPGLEFTPNTFIVDQRNIANQYDQFYTDEIREWVSKTYAKDIETYGYTF